MTHDRADPGRSPSRYPVHQVLGRSLCGDTEKKHGYVSGHGNSSVGVQGTRTPPGPGSTLKTEDEVRRQERQPTTRKTTQKILNRRSDKTRTVSGLDGTSKSLCPVLSM